jgi:hypothetical protein
MASWRRDYPETLPIAHMFKHHLATRWIRLHSLPHAQRYPKSTADWEMLLVRQNAVIDYLVPQLTSITWVWNWLAPDSHLFKSFDLIALGVFSPAADEAGLSGWLLQDAWGSGLFNVFLSMIADEQMRAFILAPECLIAPYDGGIDVILKDPHTAQMFKRYFARWTSTREDGL